MKLEVGDKVKFGEREGVVKNIDDLMYPSHPVMIMFPGCSYERVDHHDPRLKFLPPMEKSESPKLKAWLWRPNNTQVWDIKWSLTDPQGPCDYKRAPWLDEPQSEFKQGKPLPHGDE